MFDDDDDAANANCVDDTDADVYRLAMLAVYSAGGERSTESLNRT